MPWCANSLLTQGLTNLLLVRIPQYEESIPVNFESNWSGVTRFLKYQKVNYKSYWTKRDSKKGEIHLGLQNINVTTVHWTGGPHERERRRKNTQRGGNWSVIAVTYPISHVEVRLTQFQGAPKLFDRVSVNSVKCGSFNAVIAVQRYSLAQLCNRSSPSIKLWNARK